MVFITSCMLLTLLVDILYTLFKTIFSLKYKYSIAGVSVI